MSSPPAGSLVPSWPRLRIATDCSGLGSPLWTLRRMGLRFRHLWASDIDKGARSMLRQYCEPERLFRSIYLHHSERLPTPDVYIVGFPCQPFSGAGQRQGFDCLGGRIFFKVLDVIKKTKPLAFLLENVGGLETIGNGECIKMILRSLRELGTYNIYHQVLNTKDHGIPHNRPRCFFVGILKENDLGTFAFPHAIPTPDIQEFLDPRQGRPSFADLPPPSQGIARANVLHFLRQLEDKGQDPFFEPWVIECDASQDFGKVMLGVTPCLTRSRYKGHWLASYGRRINTAEALRLQGHDDDLEPVVTERQFRMMLGNSMSLNVLERLLCRLLPAAGLTPPLLDSYEGRGHKRDLEC
jgi:DNA (cytosine-5)-methyltransferase 1